MFEKNMRFAFLLDFYADILDEHTRNILKAYYEDDLSLAEIAEGEEISRQGVRHIIKKGEDELEFFESKLKLASQSADFEEACEKIHTVIKVLKDNGNFEKELNLLIDALNILLNK